MQMQPSTRPMSTPTPGVGSSPSEQIGTKDLSYLKDELSWLITAAKKCAHYEEECQDAAVRSLICDIGQMHQRHYNLLFRHLQEDASNSAPKSMSPNAPQMTAPRH
ncbi:MAG: hypothetical protein OWQ59_11595 [Alicyclobacillaceae bacterium]|uniref:hypothetical protein n=1 Tax=Alicyclobacillus sp. SP_1 TaxID=2942475 RepID=UPI002158570C|nr:hypothetical protein [Alicyclobacillus sp. SP_1]MCY0889084.1 hypothetical protein [Alicyclobacillaceae bacterium]